MIRSHSLAAARPMKEDCKAHAMLVRLAADPSFTVPLAAVRAVTDTSHFIGRAPQQVDEFLAEVFEPLLLSPARMHVPAEQVRV